MFAYLRPAVAMTVLFTALTGVAYPLAVTGIGQVLFPAAANGSLIAREGKTVGSSLIGQSFTSPGYFWSRPSAAGNGYDAGASSGSNLGPTSAKLLAAVAERAKALTDAGVSTPLPADAVTASGSGLDPEISPAYAEAQIARVAKARGLDAAKVAELVKAHEDGPLLGILGEPRVNVLTLNLALDALKAGATP